MCQLDVDECDSNPASSLGPCINTQACHNTPGAFSCECLEGWGGPTCAKDLDDCVGQCKNGATCIDLVNDYHCACATGFTGNYYYKKLILHLALMIINISFDGAFLAFIIQVAIVRQTSTNVLIHHVEMVASVWI